MSSSFYDDASLVVIPSGYKTSKVYAEKPTDGSGDLTFTRTGDTATRVNSAGLIEKVRTNLILQSEAFNTTWSATNASVTANTTANPLNGALTADTITLSAGTSGKNVLQNFSQNGVFTQSVYLKTGTHQFVQLLLGDDATPRANFDLVNGTATATSSTASIVSVGNGWFRCSMSYTTAIGSAVYLWAVDSLAASRAAATSSTGTFFAFGFQLETSDIATDLIPTTTAAVSVGPTANTARLDYLGSTCPRLLLEPQRTNLVTYSEQMDNAAWGGAGTTITANQAVSPDGYTNADLAVNAASSNYIFQGIVGSISGTFTASIFAKKGTQSSFAFGLVAAGFSGGMSVKFNFDTQTFSTPTNYANFTSISASYQSYGNGWYRLNLTGTTATSTAYFFVLGSLLESFAVNAYVYGAQLEAGAYATSYIPTLAASATRGEDVCNKTSASALIGQTEGTVFGEFSFPNTTGGGSSYFYFTDGSFSNSVIIGREPSGGVAKYMFYINASSSNVLYNTSNNIQSGFAKLAIGYKSGSWAAYLNGTLVASGTNSLTFGTMSRIGIGTNDGAITSTGDSMIAKQALLFKTRLTNAELAELTTI